MPTKELKIEYKKDGVYITAWGGSCEEIHRDFNQVGTRYERYGVQRAAAQAMMVRVDGGAASRDVQTQLRVPKTVVPTPELIPLCNLVIKELQGKGWTLTK